MNFLNVKQEFYYTEFWYVEKQKSPHKSGDLPHFPRFFIFGREGCNRFYAKIIAGYTVDIINGIIDLRSYLNFRRQKTELLFAVKICCVLFYLKKKGHFFIAKFVVKIYCKSMLHFFCKKSLLQNFYCRKD